MDEFIQDSLIENIAPAEPKSRQPRFGNVTDQSPESFFLSTMNMVEDAELTEPEYKADSRVRDSWLIEFSKKEPHLSGVLNSVTSIDKNRGWTVTGGRNQVNRITDMLHNFQCAPGLYGWRSALAYSSYSFRAADIGTIVELGSDFIGGPVRQLYCADPSKFNLTGVEDFPIKYHPQKSQKIQKWPDGSFFRIVSDPGLKEEFNGLGWCAVSKMIRLAKLMIALFRHDEERLLARAPRGLLMLSGIQRKQWDDAMKVRDANLDAANMKYFQAVAVLASAATTVDAKMVALSELPTSFNLRDWMDMLLYGYSLCLGYDASEFWPVQYGALGRGNETQIQHEKATGKGRLDFVLGFQEKLLEVLPASIDMAFDQRDEQGDLLHAQVDQAWTNVAATMYKTVVNGIPMITNEESRVLLAQYDVIPSTWSPTAEVHSTDIDEIDTEEDSPNPPDTSQENPTANNDGASTNSDGKPTAKNKSAASPTAQMKEMALWMRDKKNLICEELRDSPRVRLAAERYPRDPVVRYFSKTNSQLVLWRSGDEMLAKRIWSSAGFDYESELKAKDDMESRMRTLQDNMEILSISMRSGTVNLEKKIMDVVSSLQVISLSLESSNEDLLAAQNTIEQMRKEIDMDDKVALAIMQTLERITQRLSEPVERQTDLPPVINITVPPAEVIVNVSPTPVTVDNTITMPEKTRDVITVTRDSEGLITKMVKN
jgi:hypothetical protein